MSLTRKLTPKNLNPVEEVLKMTLVRWSPFREMEAMQSEMNRLFSRFGGFDTDQFGYDRFGQNQPGPDAAKNGQSHDNQWLLPVDVIETSDAIKLKAALPGVESKDVDIEVHDNLLTLTARRERQDKVEAGSYHWIEQRYGIFSRSVTLPRYADAEKIRASHHNGIVEIVVPKKESSKPRRVELQSDFSGPRILEAESEKNQLTEAPSP